MEMQIVIFLAFTSVTLVFNSIIILFAYRAFSNITTKVTDTMREMQTSSTTRSWISAMGTASEKAALLTGLTREKITTLGPVLDEAESRFGYGLAKVDVRFERLCNNIQLSAEKAERAILKPAHSVGAAASGVLQAVSFMAGLENDGDASSRRK
jgi:hypothetical protein